MPRLPVYCCCDASKLLGSVEVPRGAMRDGTPIHFALQVPAISLHKTEYWYEPVSVRLEVAEHVGPEGRKLAVKSMDTPIETLRRIVSWKDASGS